MHFYFDERNLPVQIGDNEYRYTADGQRYYKKVGTVEEYYIMDANMTAGVFSGTGSGYGLDFRDIPGRGLLKSNIPKMPVYFTFYLVECRKFVDLFTY